MEPYPTFIASSEPFYICHLIVATDINSNSSNLMTFSGGRDIMMARSWELMMIKSTEIYSNGFPALASAQRSGIDADAEQRTSR